MGRPDARGRNRRGSWGCKGLSDGSRIVLAFLLIWYVFPAVLALTVDMSGSFDWPQRRTDVWSSFVIAAGSIAIPALVIHNRKLQDYDAPAGTNHVILQIVALATIATSIAMHVRGESTWRYSGESMSDRLSELGGGLAVANALLQALGPLLCWWLVISDRSAWHAATSRSRTTRLLLSCAAILSINGLNSAIAALVATIAMVFPNEGNRLLFSHSLKRGRNRITLAVCALASALAIAFAYLGMVAKTGRSDAALWDSHTNGEWLIQRHSVHFQHAMSALEIGIDETDETGFDERRSITPKSAMFRLGQLLRDPRWGARPDPPTLSRWTLERFANYDLGANIRGGSSTGLIGTFALLLPPPWSHLGLACGSTLLILGLNWLLRDTPRLSIFGCAIFAFIPVRTLTDAPVELLNPFSVSFLICVLAVVAKLSCKTRSSALRSQPAPMSPGKPEQGPTGARATV
jgi:hypothetical protein